MQPSDLTIEILKGVRDDVRDLTGRVDGLSERLEDLRADTNARFESLERRQTEAEVRLSTELIAVVSAVHEVRDLLREDRALGDRVDDHDRRLVAIETQRR